MELAYKKILLDAVLKYDTPIYIYDADIIQNRYQHLRDLGCDNLDIFYSMKANPALGVCQLIETLGAGCEVSSKIELKTALAAGFDPKNIIFIGPGKKIDEVAASIIAGIYAIVAESIAEIIQINQVAKIYGKVVAVIIRLNPKFQIKNAPLKMSGRASQFGIDIDELSTQFVNISKLININIIGIHVYNGTRILDANSIIENTENIFQLAVELANQFSIQFEAVGIGGGFGVPYSNSEQKLDTTAVMQTINDLIRLYFKNHKKIRIILESGRYLVAESGFLIGSIINIKKNHGKQFIITDAGAHCYSKTGMGSFTQRNASVDIIEQSATDNSRPDQYAITGPLCTPGDVVAKDVMLKNVAIGDYLIQKNVGAYGLTASPGRFISHGFPAEILLIKKTMFLIRKRDRFRDVLENQLSIAFK